MLLKCYLCCRCLCIVSIAVSLVVSSAVWVYHNEEEQVSLGIVVCVAWCGGSSRQSVVCVMMDGLLRCVCPSSAQEGRILLIVMWVKIGHLQDSWSAYQTLMRQLELDACDHQPALAVVAQNCVVSSVTVNENEIFHTFGGCHLSTKEQGSKGVCFSDTTSSSSSTIAYLYLWIFQSCQA